MKAEPRTRVTALAQSSDGDTRQRLLEAAGLVFAEQGFRAATVRDICRRAGANVAAVNYHFGDKHHLYAAVLEHALQVAFDRHPSDGGIEPEAPAEARLEAFVRAFMFRLLGDGGPAWLGRIMAREMIEPTDALDDLVERVHKPLFERLRAIVAELCGPQAPARAVLLCTQSIVAQCVFYRHAQAVIQRMQHERPPIDELAAHITRFSLAALRECANASHAEVVRSATRVSKRRPR